MWYVLQTRSGNEENAVEKCRHLLEGGNVGRAFTMRYCYAKKYLGEWHIEKAVLFPGYLFVESSIASEKLEKTFELIPDVVTPVITGGGFYPIDESEENFLRSMSDEKNCIRMSEGYISSGELIIEEGPLSGKTEAIRKIDRHKRMALMEVSLWHEIRTVKVGLEVKAKVG